MCVYMYMGFPGSSAGKDCNAEDPKIPWRMDSLPTSVFLPGKSLWTEEPGGLQSMGSQRVGHD